MVFVLMILLGVHLETVRVLGGIRALRTSIWTIWRVTLQVALEHGPVNALIGTF